MFPGTVDAVVSNQKEAAQSLCYPEQRRQQVQPRREAVGWMIDREVSDVIFQDQGRTVPSQLLFPWAASHI